MPAVMAQAMRNSLRSSAGPGSATEASPATAARANGSIAGRHTFSATSGRGASAGTRASRPRIER